MQIAKEFHRKGFIKEKKMVTQSQIPNILFSAKLDNIKIFYTTLKAVNFNNDANIIISPDGLKIIVEEAKYVQALLYITKHCFSEYTFSSDDEVDIRLNITVVTDCLSIFAGADCSMKLYYKGRGAPLVLVLEQHSDDDLITEVSVKTKNSEENLDFALDEEDESYTKLIMRGADFSNLLNEINKASDVLEIYMSPRPPHFRLTSLGEIQTQSNVEVAKTSDMFVSYLCQKQNVARYKMSHIRLAMKALGIAGQVALQTDKSGLLQLQIRALAEGEAHIFLEHYITPLVDDEE